MKVLTTEQQVELQGLLEGLKDENLDTQGQINYWALELKPKRVRRKSHHEDPNIQHDLTYKTNIGIDA